MELVSCVSADGNGIRMVTGFKYIEFRVLVVLLLGRWKWLARIIMCMSKLELLFIAVENGISGNGVWYE